MGHPNFSRSTSLLACTLLALIPWRSSADAGWSQIVTWVSSNGGWVDPSLQESMTFHGGAEIRGIISTKSLLGQSLVLEVPQKLWFTLDHFPELQRAPLEGIGECEPGKDELDRMKLAAAIALETKKGDASFHSAHLRMCPTFKEFRSFHPRLMDASLLAAFSALPIVASTRQVQAQDEKRLRCFRKWQQSPGSPVVGVSWDDMLTAYLQIQTRGHHVGGTPVLIPAADMMNTAKEQDLNTQWGVDGSGGLVAWADGILDSLKAAVASDPQERKFKIRTKDSVYAGHEMYEHYCPDCDNSKMMERWGVYLEDNPNALRGTPLDCAAQSGKAARGRNASTPSSLRAVAEAALDLDDVATAGSQGRLAPRCRRETLTASDRGPLHCSLARLAWEHCAVAWGRAAPPGTEPAIPLLAQRKAPVPAPIRRSPP